jgi:hypothetical protein
MRCRGYRTQLVVRSAAIMARRTADNAEVLQCTRRDYRQQHVTVQPELNFSLEMV